MTKGRKTELTLNLATMTMLAVAVGMWMRGAPSGGPATEVGEPPVARAPDAVMLEALASGDTLRWVAGAPALFLVFRSTCPACRANLESWRDVMSRLPDTVQAFAVGLEDRRSAGTYARLHLEDALGVRPMEIPRFTRDFRVLAVPATLLIDAAGRVTMHRSGVLDSRAVEDILRAARAVSPR